MEKKKIIFINNNFQKSDGTVTALISIVNSLDPEKFDITVKAVYKCDESIKNMLNPNIKLEKMYGFYFRGFKRIVRKLPMKYLYNKYIGSKYDIEVGFQCDVPTLLVGNSLNEKAVHVAWIHGYQLHPKEHINCDKVVCVSKYNAERAKKEMNGNINVTYCYNLLTDDVIKQMSLEDIPLEHKTSDYPKFITVGRLSPEKGFARLVKIFGELKEEGYKFHLTIVGEGKERKNIEQNIKKYNLFDSVMLTGATSNPHKYTAKSDIFICSSYSEGYSTATTEAAVLRIPIITTNVPGGKEIINDCECGVLTGIDDNSLKAGIKKVLDKPKLITEWKKIISNTSYKFGYENRKKEMIKLFDELWRISNNKLGIK